MKTDKLKHKGDIGLSLIECIDTRLQSYLIRTFVSEETDDERGTKGIVFRQFEYEYKPTLEEAVTDIISAIPDEPINLTEIATMAELLDEEPMEPMRKALLHNVEIYDTSSAVKSFSYGAQTEWFLKEKRVGLVNSITTEKNAGKEMTALWLSGEKYVLPVDTALQMLAALELYSLECYNVTEEHKVAVRALENVEDIIAYDYTANYPSKLIF